MNELLSVLVRQFALKDVLVSAASTYGIFDLLPDDKNIHHCYYCTVTMQHDIKS